ncbi:DUF7935 family protein [Phaeocystidibacter luteus]|uniref:Uncharacterized protein n=1 Tax=Phaeocystidibacter luteus TaxID=911197 RepID=A0A6N6RH66_9FLAO|nr:hypothetical protein [Phaeocystidibacter luteus]KAB2809805.1 hypothetical protein F8C67_09630 [Phaeocystidibacter luteus]
MEIFLEILKYTFPALLMLLLAYLMLSNFTENEENRRRYYLRKETQKQALPVRLQAYERLTLFLERITPSSLLVRIPSKGLSASEYQSLLLKTIRNEFEYNLSQQIYISEEAWQMVVTAKSATVSIVNRVASQLPEGSTGAELSKKILEHAMELGTFPTRNAIHYMKSEAYKEF